MTQSVNKDYYFAQNLNAAQEGALIARLSRLKNEINKAKIAINAQGSDTSNYQVLEEELLSLRTKYFKILNRLNTIRGKNRDKELKEDSNVEERQISFYTDRDFYIPSFISVTKDTNPYEEMRSFNEFKGKISSPNTLYQPKIVETAAVYA
jgi:hypothetical protein